MKATYLGLSGALATYAVAASSPISSPVLDCRLAVLAQQPLERILLSQDIVASLSSADRKDLISTLITEQPEGVIAIKDSLMLLPKESNEIILQESIKTQRYHRFERLRKKGQRFFDATEQAYHFLITYLEKGEP